MNHHTPAPFVVDILARKPTTDPRLIAKLTEMKADIETVTAHMHDRHGFTPYETAETIEQEWNTSPEVAMLRLRYRLMKATRPPVTIEVL